MTAAGAERLPQRGRGPMEAADLLFIVLAALIFFEAAHAVNAALHESALFTAAPLKRGVQHLVLGLGSDASFHERVEQFWMQYHRTIAVGVLFAAVTALLIRFLAIERALDYLFEESPASDRRGMGACLFHGLMALLHAGAIYALVAVAVGPAAHLTPVVFVALMAINVVWLVLTVLGMGRDERRGSRGLVRLVITSLAGGALVFALTWIREGQAMAGPLLASELIVVTSCAALALCVGEAWWQSKVYGARKSEAEAEAV